MCIALAATGIAVLDTATPSGAAPTTSTVTATDAAYTTAAKRQERRRHNPHGKTYVHRNHNRAWFHGTAVDPDRRHHRLKIALWHNGHRVALRKTHQHHYGFHVHLRPGKNTFSVYARNVGKGTYRSHLRTRHMRMHEGWAAHYHGEKHAAARMFKYHGWGQRQMQSLINLWNRESGWSKTAANSSGAYGIPQALPGSKMSSAGPNWRYNAHTQIRWGLRYIDSALRFAQQRLGTLAGHRLVLSPIPTADRAGTATAVPALVMSLRSFSAVRSSRCGCRQPRPRT